MRRIIFTIIMLATAVACNKEEQLLQSLKNDAPIFTTSFEEYNIATPTKTYIDQNIKLYWHEADEVTIFRTTLNEKYTFDGNTGDNSGTFSAAGNGGQFGTGNAIEAYYAIYPYSSNSSMDNYDVLTVELPATQLYAQNSFGKGANTMVAVTSGLSDYFLSFKNVGGYLVLKLYGSGITVKSIELKGNNGEKIAGDATITAKHGQMPNSYMNSNATRTITLDCGESGVEIGNSAENATNFWIVVPPTIFSNGFTVTITDNAGWIMKQSTSNNYEVKRNLATLMAPLEVTTDDIAVPNDEIWYTTTDGNIIEPTASADFGVSITSNEYTNGKGIIKFDGEVKYIGKDAFENISNSLSFTLPNSIETICYGAFYENSNLEKITLPENLKSIEKYAFGMCTSIKQITIPDKTTYIGDFAFDCCHGLTEITIPSSVEEIGVDPFYCQNLKAFYGKFATDDNCALVKDDTLKSFAINCDVKDYIVPDGVKIIGRYTFHQSKISTLTLPDSFVDIEGSYVLSGMANLQGIYGKFASEDNRCLIINGEVAAFAPYNIFQYSIPYGATSIRTWAFGQSPLREVELPETINYIGECAFFNNSYLTSITIPDGVSVIKRQAFSECTRLKEVIFSNNITAIERFAFDYCPLSYHLYLPESLETIGSSAFWNTDVAVVHIPQNVKEINVTALHDCQYLFEVHCATAVPPTITGGTASYNLFGGSEVPVNIYVPAGSVEAYKNADEWKEHASRIFAEPEAEDELE